MTAYHELDTPQAMRSDASRVAALLPVAAPSLRFDDYPQDLPKPEIAISEAAQRLANALHLHLD